MRELTPENDHGRRARPDGDNARPAPEDDHGVGGQAPPCLRPRRQSDPGGMDQGHRIRDDRRRQDVLAGTAGIHPAVRHARPLGARQWPARRHRPRGSHQHQPAWPVLPRGHADAAPPAVRSPKTRSRAANARFTAASPTPPASRSPTPPSRSGRPAPTVSTISRTSATSVDYRGVFATDADGLYVLRTVKPLGYSIPMDGLSARW